jgi:hypothetical protein
MPRARHTDVFQHLIGEIWQQIEIDVVGCEGISVLREAEVVQPRTHAEAHSAAPGHQDFIRLC